MALDGSAAISIAVPRSVLQCQKLRAQFCAASACDEHCSVHDKIAAKCKCLCAPLLKASNGSSAEQRRMALPCELLPGVLRARAWAFSIHQDTSIRKGRIHPRPLAKGPGESLQHSYIDELKLIDALFNTAMRIIFYLNI